MIRRWIPSGPNGQGGWLCKFEKTDPTWVELDDPFKWVLGPLAYSLQAPDRILWIKNPGCMETDMGHWKRLFGRLYWRVA